MKTSIVNDNKYTYYQDFILVKKIPLKFKKC